MKRLLALLLLVTAHSALSAERDYQRLWCDRNLGQTEVVLADQTRIDCVTERHAIEFDFAKKWAESIGQALHYAQSTGKRGGIVLIMAPGEERFVERAIRVVGYYHLPIDVWTMSK